ncbi:hypothetical protein AB0C96_23925 [Streptomyces sp. NPDC048506]|uniref:hypothetical protein n=1 Tax=Streptomyces sp. NPDC048506 TaxID=3155028 RepID=UPI00341E717E
MPLSTTALRRSRRLAAASLVAAAALSLTACQEGGDKASAAPSASAVSPTPSAPAGQAAADGGNGGGNGAGAGTTKGKNTARTRETPGQGRAAGGQGGGAGTPGGASAGRHGVDGTWVGTLKWLTEDKLTVAPKTGTEQAFYIADSTEVLGAAGICEAPDGRVHADGSGYGTTSCTLADLRKAARLGVIDVRVTVADGVATKVAEHYHP